MRLCSLETKGTFCPPLTSLILSSPLPMISMTHFASPGGTFGRPCWQRILPKESITAIAAAMTEADQRLKRHGRSPASASTNHIRRRQLRYYSPTAHRQEQSSRSTPSSTGSARPRRRRLPSATGRHAAYTWHIAPHSITIMHHSPDRKNPPPDFSRRNCGQHSEQMHIYQSKLSVNVAYRKWITVRRIKSG